MAKAKKLTEKELEELKSVIEAEGQMKGRFFESSVAFENAKQGHESVWRELVAAQQKILELRDKFSKKYGDVNINIQTGEFVEGEGEN